jgi:hypothetical protein
MVRPDAMAWMVRTVNADYKVNVALMARRVVMVLTAKTGLRGYRANVD